jgi:hypothetical protein
MKKIAICFSLFTNILFAQDSTLVKGIALPELSVLYTTWDNKIVPFVEGEDSLILEIEGATATPKTWTADGCEYHGYYVNVNPKAKQVCINLKGLNQNLDTISYGKYRYKVKPFPTPQVYGTVISKGSGTKVIVGLGPDSPFTGVNFEITGGEVTVGDITTPFSGDRIIPAVVANASPGNFVIIDVFYTRDGINGKPISAKLRVVN